MGIGSAAMIMDQSQMLRRAAEERARALSRTFAVIGAATMLDQRSVIQDAMARHLQDQDLLDIDIVNTDHLIVAAKRTARIGYTLDDPIWRQATAGDREVITQIQTMDGGPALLIIEPLLDNEAVTAWVRVVFSLAGVDQEIREITVRMIVVILALMLAGLVAIRLTLRRVSAVLEQTIFQLRIPLQTLSSDRLPDGTYPEASPHQGDLEHLTQVVAQTTEVIQAQSFAFRELTASLEAKVQERTVELAVARDQAMQSSRVKSQFLANMSHEIRTPMNGVLGMTDLLRNTELTAKQRRFVEAVHRSAISLLEIINDILDFSKIEAGKLELEQVDFCVSETVEEVMELFAEMARKKSIELACFVSQDVPTHLKGDPGRLRQILTNLVSNAVKFTDRGEVVLQVETGPSDRLCLRFAVRDTGIGMKAETLGRIFSPFTQEDSSTTRRYGGSGLGLAIVKQLVGLMHGEVGADSKPGLGSTFWFTAQFKQSTLTADTIDRSRHTLRGRRVLIVDDNATNRMILEHYAEQWGMSHQSAQNGIEALALLDLALLRHEPFHIAILDMLMPGMDGLELARKIRTNSVLADVHLIMLTSLGQYGDAEAARAVGIQLYLTKPVRQNHLLNSLLSLIGQSHAPQVLVTDAVSKTDASPLNGYVLLAEDHPVNQEVARAMLEFLGCRVQVVENGREAVHAVETTTYDLVLMDCQMPEMDGLEATRTIRRWESNTRKAGHVGTHIPIIALTAHALDGDRGQCLSAGMDAYVTKPFSQTQLRTILEQWLPQRDQPIQNRPQNRLGESILRDKNKTNTAEATLESNPLDLKILANIDALQQTGRPDLLVKILTSYLNTTPSIVQSIQQAIREDNASGLHHAAHSLKSSSAAVGAISFSALCQELESIGRSKQMEHAAACSEKFAAAYEAVHKALTEHLLKRTNRLTLSPS